MLFTQMYKAKCKIPFSHHIQMIREDGCCKSLLLRGCLALTLSIGEGWLTLLS